MAQRRSGTSAARNSFFSQRIHLLFSGAQLFSQACTELFIGIPLRHSARVRRERISSPDCLASGRAPVDSGFLAPSRLFFDMQMVTMGLHGQSKPYAGEKFALFLALPDEAHREGGPLLTLPYKSGFHLEVRDQMLGIFCQWEFLYNIGRDNVTFRRFERSPNYTSYLCTPRIGFRMKWMERLEESRWLEFPLFLNNSVHCERNTP